MEIIEIKHITKEEAGKIIETRKPRGLFYETDNGFYVGIDNRSGDAWVEEFKTARECLDWLRGGQEMREEREEYLTELQRKQLKIIYHYGPDKQLNMLVEECGELIQAIMKMKRISSTLFFSHDVVQEMADVKNIIRQLELRYGNLCEAINITMEQKVDRQLERIEKGE